jgi:CheY-like chemotaxis protein
MQINKAGRRAAGLIEQILAAAREQVVQPRVLDLNATVIDMEQMLRRVVGADVKLVTILEPELGLVKADVGQIERVIINLAVNARDAMPHGGTLVINTKNVRIDGDSASTGTGAQPGSYVMLAVTDTGKGMDEETKSRVFEPFFSTKPKGIGTGLGLSAVQGIVKQSGGYIRVHSEPGRGTTFKTYLPRIDEDAEVAKLEAAKIESFEGSETVLLVENDDVACNSALSVLRHLGYRVLQARDGTEALRICEHHQGLIDLTVTNVAMPAISGKELPNSLHCLCPGTRMLFISEHAGNVAADYEMLSSQVNFLEKPFSPESLARKVREVLDGPRR